MNRHEEQAISDEISVLLTKRAIHRCEPVDDQFVSTIFTRVKRNGSIRMILNLKQLNLFIKYRHFKMEHLDSVLDMVQQNDFFCSIDLTDAYFSVPIHSEHRKYLRFAWKSQLYEYQVLCFGLSSAPWLFTKITKPVMAYMRNQGTRCSIYIDDCVIMGHHQTTLLDEVEQLCDLFTSLGFAINVQKSILIPTRTITHLGNVIDSSAMSVSIPAERLLRVQANCSSLLDNASATIREVSSVVGSLLACTTGVKWGRLHYRDLERDKLDALRHQKGDFDKIMPLSQTAKQNLLWWGTNAVNIPCDIITPDYDYIVTTDSSMEGWGAQCLDNSAGGRWSVVEARNHINWLELKAGFLGLRAFAKSDSTILLRMDNQVALAYVKNQGGKIHSLNELAVEIWEWCRIRNVLLITAYIPGIENILADTRSREFNDSIEWSLKDSLFSQVTAVFGVPDVDLFASRLNHKVRRYCSWEADPDCLWVDAFTLRWHQFGLVYAFPPFNLVGKVLNKARRDRVDLILIAPRWPTKYWFGDLIASVHPNDILQWPITVNALELPGKPGVLHPMGNKLCLCAFRLSNRR